MNSAGTLTSIYCWNRGAFAATGDDIQLLGWAIYSCNVSPQVALSSDLKLFICGTNYTVTLHTRSPKDTILVHTWSQWGKLCDLIFRLNYGRS